VAPDNLEGTANMILQIIKTNPGSYLRKIKENLNISMGTTQYHLDKLEKMGRITSTRNGLHKHYFPIGVFEENEKEILQVLGQETAREIIMTIIEKQAPTQTDIVNSVGISGASANWHLKRLIAIKLVEEIREGHFKRYRMFDIKTSTYVTTLMRNYYPTIWNKWSNRLIEIFLSLSNDEHKLEGEGDKT
jgi:predicted transcriptional regulator